jgi:rare lipoprotein A
VFKPDGLTAAHRTLPFGTRIRVSNPRNGRSVIVRINDRNTGPKDIAIDLSRGAARQLGIAGIGTVAMTVVSPVSKDRVAGLEETR